MSEETKNNTQDNYTLSKVTAYRKRSETLHILRAYEKIVSHSHNSSPVERGFANVWRFMRKKFDRTKHTTSEILQMVVGMTGAEEGWYLCNNFKSIKIDFLRASLLLAKGHWNL